MKVWLDDVRPLPFHYDIRVKTVKHAIKLIDLGLVTEISLDNDLGDVYWDGSPTGEGRQVAAYIEKGAAEGTIPRIQMYSHTANTVAEADINAAINNAEKYWKKKE